jgi:hypothetical protein
MAEVANVLAQQGARSMKYFEAVAFELLIFAQPQLALTQRS